MKFSYSPYQLKFIHPFNLASGSRHFTDVIFVEIEYENQVGYGEASFPPYLGVTPESAKKFFSKVRLSQFNGPFKLREILDYIDGIEEGHTAAKAAIDIALHDLLGKLFEQPVYQLLGSKKEDIPITSYTIGIDVPVITKQKIFESKDFKLLKIKLGTNDDKSLVDYIRIITDKRICVDVNQHWKDRELALDMAFWLQDRGVEMIEQPMPENQLDDIAWLTEQSPIPIFADESVKRLADIDRIKGAYSGINIKLMKSTGLHEAKLMIDKARREDLGVLLGCMAESSCAVTAATNLAALADWVDLDSPLLVSNDPFKGVVYMDGKILHPGGNGIGVQKRE